MMTQQLDIIDGISDDMSIAQALLGGPNIPLRQRSSFASTTRSVVEAANKLNERDGSTGIKNEGRRRMIQSSNTWTASSGEALSELDDIEDRSLFVNEYNRLATKHGVRRLVPEDPDNADSANTSKGSWFSRKILRRTSSSQSVKAKSDRYTKHRRSISDLSLRSKSKNNSLKDKDLQELVRLCGLSLLYLPTEYATTSLAVPTCFRATAQYLVQHAPTARGVFRIPGSHSVVASLYNHYCAMDSHGEVVAGTVRCPTLPEHIRCDVHDVASAFKKFISGLPGGILGSLPLFDAFISIQSQLNGVPELTRTKQSKIRARLIALAIATLQSQYRRELICAVFGLLSMIGRAAEIAPRENERGRPLPTSDLMGYGPLGIVFGPLLIGDLLENYTMHLANPRSGLVLLPISPPRSRKEKCKKSKASEDTSAFHSHVDKIQIANKITEMLITHWRDVVRHMRNLRALKIVRSYKSLEATTTKQPFLRPSVSEAFNLRKPPDWDNDKSPITQIERCESPTPASRAGGLLEGRLGGRSSPKFIDTLNVRKQRARPRPMSSQMLSGSRSMSILSPTKEENLAECSPESDTPSLPERTSVPRRRHKCSPPPTATPAKLSSVAPSASASLTPPAPTSVTQSTRTLVGQHIRPSTTQPTQPYQNMYPFSDSPGVPNATIFAPPEILAGEGSKPVEEHSLKDCPPIPKQELKDNRPTSKEDLKGCPPAAKHRPSSIPVRLMGPRAPEPQAQQFPAITISQAPFSGKAKPDASALRRISVSEPGRRVENQTRRPLRPSKSTYGDAAHRVSVRDWALPKDPLARVSVADDIASLAALAHVLEEEPADPEPILQRSAKLENSKQPPRSNREYNMAVLLKAASLFEARSTQTQETTQFTKFVRESAEEEVRGTLSKQKYDGLWRCLEELTDAEAYHRPLGTMKKAGISKIPVKKLEERPKAFEGPNYSHLSRSTPSPKKKSSDGPSPRSRSPINIKLASPVVSVRTSTVDVDIDKTDVSVNESPRVSVRALAAKFNTVDSRSLSSPSPSKSPSKASSIDVRAVSDCSPKEKIISPYTTNPPSPTKSQKSGKSDVFLHSIRIAPPPERTFAKLSPPRRLLRSDLKDSTPLRSVRKSMEEVAASTKGALTLDSSELPACCSPPGSPQRLSLYDGTSFELSGSASSDPIPCLLSPHVHFESRRVAATSEKTITTSYFNEPSFIPMAINPLTSPPPTRSNSLLHAQIRTLQQQLSSKTEEIRHLKQQLGVRGTLDIGTLGGELRDAKKETQMWKGRAEVAEKQLEVMATLSTRSTRHKTENSPSISFGSSTAGPSRTFGYREDGAIASEKARRILPGMDGPSSHPSSSEGSTETVVRDSKERATTGSDYSLWVEQTMDTIEYMAAQGTE